jgi:hypothetical protein
MLAGRQQEIRAEAVPASKRVLEERIKGTRHPPTISKHYATIISNLAVHIRLGLSSVSLS